MSSTLRPTLPSSPLVPTLPNPPRKTKLPRCVCFGEHALIHGDTANSFSMAHLNCAYDFATPGDHLRAIRDNAPACIERLDRMPQGARAVYLIWFMAYQSQSKQWGNNPDGSLRWSPLPDSDRIRREGIDTQIPSEQMTLFGSMLRKAKVTINLVYIDHEDDLHQSVPDQYRVRAKGLRDSVLLGDPLASRRTRHTVVSPMVANFNFCNPHRNLPAFAWWGPLISATIDGSSCPEAYFTRSKKPGSGNQHWLWESFVCAINAIRSCAMPLGSQKVVPWLSGPVSKKKIGHGPDSQFGQDEGLWEVATWLTEQFIMHAGAMGIKYFGLANYMIDDAERPKVEARIDAAMRAASQIIPGPWKWRDVGKVPAFVRTSQFLTTYQDFLSRLPTAERAL